MWRRGQAPWGGIDPHDRLQVTGRIGRLRGDLLHFTAESIDSQIAKISRYSADFVREQLARNQHSRQLELWVRPFWRFLRAYVFRLGFLDGWQGLYVAWFTAYYTMVRYAKLREAKPKMNANIPFPSQTRLV